MVTSNKSNTKSLFYISSLSSKQALNIHQIYHYNGTAEIGKRGQWERKLPYKSSDLSLIPGTHGKVEGKN